jgi:hypothetical protein
LTLPLRRSLTLFLGGTAGLFAVLPHPRNHVGEFVAAAVIIAVSAAAGSCFAARAGLESPVLDAAIAGRLLLFSSSAKGRSHPQTNPLPSPPDPSRSDARRGRGQHGTFGCL